ncbi:MAG TPA: ATP-binding protein, partial [Opitutaceae bacterium]
ASEETRRLATLRDYGVLDTATETAYDDLTRLAAHACQTSFALLSFVDERRLWFKASHGFATPRAAMPREGSFCAHAVDEPQKIFEVADALLDAQFATHPLVTGELGVRFYAGAPLVAPNGAAVGTLCVLDRTPRTLGADQREALWALSRQVVAQLELHRLTSRLTEGIGERERNLANAEQARRSLETALDDERRSAMLLRESEARFRQIAENINEVYWITDLAKRTIFYVSPAYETIWGQSCQSLYEDPRLWLESIHPEDRGRVLLAATTKQVAGTYNEVYRVVRPDGGLRWVRDRAFPVRDEHGEIYRLVGTVIDITEYKKADLRGRVLHEVTAVLAESAPLVDTARRVLEIVCQRLDLPAGDLWLEDRASRVLRCVALWHRPESGFEAFAAATRRITFGPGEGLPGRVWQQQEPTWFGDLGGNPAFLRREHALGVGLRGGVGFPIMARNQVYGVVGLFSFTDTRPEPAIFAMFAGLGAQLAQFVERKHLEEQFRQSQKMEAIGTLAGGIAHDFNNVLAAITGYTELAKMEVQGNADLAEYLKAIGEGGARAADLVRQILAFSRLQEQRRNPVQLAPVIEEALKLLRATIPVSIEFDISLERGGPAVLADPTQIHQVLMNLVTNAAQAMRARPGRLGVTLESLVLDREFVSLHPGLHQGLYQRLCVSDTGHGMDAATQGRIFDPFFTTKAPGEGTGLGLAVVHGIVQAHDGIITVYSQPGQGTRFHLYFPAHLDDSGGFANVPAAAPRGRGEQILLVDDEQPLITMGRRMLERLGYRCAAFTHPAEALQAYRQAPETFALAITDLTMPTMSGIDLAEQLLQLRPDLAVILTTGYNASLTPERVRALGMRQLLLKPLTLNTLAEAVHRELAN